MNQQLDNKLIENALVLTGKTLDDVTVDTIEYYDVDVLDVSTSISIENFCYYLLSPEFIEKYRILENSQWEHEDDFLEEDSITMYFWKAIWQYQSGNSEPLIELLSKIWN